MLFWISFLLVLLLFFFFLLFGLWFVLCFSLIKLGEEWGLVVSWGACFCYCAWSWSGMIHIPILSQIWVVKFEHLGLCQILCSVCKLNCQQQILSLITSLCQLLFLLILSCSVLSPYLEVFLEAGKEKLWTLFFCDGVFSILMRVVSALGFCTICILSLMIQNHTLYHFAEQPTKVWQAPINHARMDEHTRWVFKSIGSVSSSCPILSSPQFIILTTDHQQMFAEIIHFCPAAPIWIFQNFNSN
jgi:hypothetical protein